MSGFPLPGALPRGPGSGRLTLEWQAGQRGKPGINADIQNSAEATRMIADPDFELQGTNVSSSATGILNLGGISLQTAGTSGDQAIICPHEDASQSQWAVVNWIPSAQTEWSASIKTGASVADTIIWAGLKLTSTSTVATDDDQVFFRYEDGVADDVWRVHNSIGGTDDVDASTVTLATATVYNFRISIDESRIARCYLNGALVATTAALTSAAAFRPFIGVETAAAAAKGIVVYGQEISRVLG